VCVCGARDLCVNAECAVLNRAAAGRSRFYHRALRASLLVVSVS